MTIQQALAPFLRDGETPEACINRIGLALLNVAEVVDWNEPPSLRLERIRALVAIQK